MTSTIFPAAPGTYILHMVEGQKGAMIIPVIAFQHIQAGVVFPLTIMPNPGLTRGRALQTPDGLVSDPSFGLVFADQDQWVGFVETHPEYWTKTESTKSEEPNANAMANQIAAEIKPGTDLDDLTERPVGREGEVVQRRIPDKPKSPRAPRVFKSNSYWKFQKDSKKHDPAWDCIWIIPGGEVVPFENDPIYTKITGDEYKALKKAGWKEIDPRANRGEHHDRQSAHEFIAGQQQADENFDDLV